MAYLLVDRVGADISGGVPDAPDTSVAGGSCRREARASRPPLTAARVRARCDSVTTGMAKTYLANSRAAFLLAAQALDASLRVNPYYRESLIFRANTALGLHDSVTALAMSRRLIAVDPITRTGINTMAYDR